MDQHRTNDEFEDVMENMNNLSPPSSSHEKDKISGVQQDEYQDNGEDASMLQLYNQDMEQNISRVADTHWDEDTAERSSAQDLELEAALKLADTVGESTNKMMSATQELEEALKLADQHGGEDTHQTTYSAQSQEESTSEGALDRRLSENQPQSDFKPRQSNGSTEVNMTAMTPDSLPSTPMTETPNERLEEAFPATLTNADNQQGDAIGEGLVDPAALSMPPPAPVPVAAAPRPSSSFVPRPLGDSSASSQREKLISNQRARLLARRRNQNPLSRPASSSWSPSVSSANEEPSGEEGGLRVKFVSPNAQSEDPRAGARSFSSNPHPVRSGARASQLTASTPVLAPSSFRSRSNSSGAVSHHSNSDVPRSSLSNSSQCSTGGAPQSSTVAGQERAEVGTLDYLDHAGLSASPSGRVSALRIHRLSVESPPRSPSENHSQNEARSSSQPVHQQPGLENELGDDRLSTTFPRSYQAQREDYRARQQMANITTSFDEDEQTLETDYTDFATAHPRSPEGQSLESTSQMGQILYANDDWENPGEGRDAAQEPALQNEYNNPSQEEDEAIEQNSRVVRHRGRAGNNSVVSEMTYEGLDNEDNSHRVQEDPQRSVSPLQFDNQRLRDPSPLQRAETQALRRSQSDLSNIRSPSTNNDHGTISHLVTRAVPQVEMGRRMKGALRSFASERQLMETPGNEKMSPIQEPMHRRLDDSRSVRSGVSAFSRGNKSTRSRMSNTTLGKFHKANLNKAEFQHVRSKVDSSAPAVILKRSSSPSSLQVMVSVEGSDNPRPMIINRSMMCSDLYRFVANALAVPMDSFMLVVLGRAVSVAKTSIRLFGISDGVRLTVVFKDGTNLDSARNQGNDEADQKHVEWDQPLWTLGQRSQSQSSSSKASRLRRQKWMADVPELALLEKLGLENSPDKEIKNGQVRPESFKEHEDNDNLSYGSSEASQPRPENTHQTSSSPSRVEDSQNENRRLKLQRLHFHMTFQNFIRRISSYKLSHAFHTWSSKVWLEASRDFQQNLLQMEEQIEGQEEMLRNSQNCLKDTLKRQMESDQELNQWVYNCASKCSEQMNLLKDLRSNISTDIATRRKRAEEIRKKREAAAAKKANPRGRPQTKSTMPLSRRSRSMGNSGLQRSRSGGLQKNVADQKSNRKNPVSTGGYVDMLKSGFTKSKAAKEQDSVSNRSGARENGAPSEVSEEAKVDLDSPLHKIDDIMMITQSLLALHQECLALLGGDQVEFAQGSPDNNSTVQVSGQDSSPLPVPGKISLGGTLSFGNENQVNQAPASPNTVPGSIFINADLKKFYNPNVSSSANTSPTGSISSINSNTRRKSGTGRKLIMKQDEPSFPGNVLGHREGAPKRMPLQRSGSSSSNGQSRNRRRSSGSWKRN